MDIEKVAENNEPFKFLAKEFCSDSGDTMANFANLHRASHCKNCLSAKSKKLIALAIAISVHSDGCIAFHVHDALEEGATREEIFETINLAVLMGGGPAMVYASQAIHATDQLINKYSE